MTVAALQLSTDFYGGVLGLQLARVFPERKVAFYWLGAPGKAMLGLWAVGTAPVQMKLHLAFTVELRDLLEAPARLRAANLTPRDFAGSANRTSSETHPFRATALSTLYRNGSGQAAVVPL